MKSYIPILENSHEFSSTNDCDIILDKKTGVEFTIKTPIKREILALINGKDDIDDIRKKLKANYPKKSDYKLKYEVHRLLVQLDRANFINWDDSNNPYNYVVERKIHQISDDERIYQAHESDYKKLFEYFEKADIYKDHPLNDEFLNITDASRKRIDYCQDVNLRYMLFNFAEEFFVYEVKNEIQGVVALYNSEFFSTVSVISAKKNICFKTFLKEQFAFIKKVIGNSSRKIKVQYIADNKIDNKLAECLTQIGFEFEALLKKDWIHEEVEKDVNVYSLLLKNKIFRGQ